MRFANILFFVRFFGRWYLPQFYFVCTCMKNVSLAPCSPSTATTCVWWHTRIISRGLIAFLISSIKQLIRAAPKIPRTRTKCNVNGVATLTTSEAKKGVLEAASLATAAFSCSADIAIYFAGPHGPLDHAQSDDGGACHRNRAPRGKKKRLYLARCHCYHSARISLLLLLLLQAAKKPRVDCPSNQQSLANSLHC